jgi:1,4-dihydroxy-2-naphthoate octaprenyltransferase
MLSIVLGAYLVMQSNYIILSIGITSISTTYFYSGGPRPLANMAFGEFLSFIFFGPIACYGTYYIQLSNIDNLQLLNSVSIGFFVSCVMLANNIRDIETDKIAGKLTIAVRIGEKTSKKLYIAFVVTAYLISLILRNWAVLLSIPFAIMIIRNFLAPQKEKLQNVMENTSALTLLYAALLCLKF